MTFRIFLCKIKPSWVFIFLIIASCSASRKVSTLQEGIFEDNRDGKTYHTIKIGSQVWISENLAYKPEEGKFWIYENVEGKSGKLWLYL